MQKTVYEDYKYSMQDTGNIYVGCKYTFGELLEQEDILFKFRLIMLLTLSRFRTYLAGNERTAGIYNRMKGMLYGRKKGEV